MSRRISAFTVLAVLFLITPPVPGQVAGGSQGGHEGGPARFETVPQETRDAIGRLIMQDYQGRMKPVDTLARAVVRKITKRFAFEDWDPVDMYLSWLASPDHWWEQPLIYVRDPGVKDLIGVDPATTHVSAGSLFGPDGGYILQEAVAEAHQTPDRDRTKVQRRLIGFDERVNLFYLAVQGRSFRVFPVPGDANRIWLDGDTALGRVSGADREAVRVAWFDFRTGLFAGNADRLAGAVVAIAELQRRHGAAELPAERAVSAEILLNRWRPFSRVLWLYGLAALPLLAAFAWGLARRGGEPYALGHPLYLLGSVCFWAATAVHFLAYTARWIASGRAPLSNGYESLVFIALSVALAGFFFELRDRRGVASGLGSLLAFVILGVSMMSHFDPAIGLLVPVLNSYWLNIHVTVITASYGFLGLGALIGLMVLLLHFAKGPGRDHVRRSIAALDNMLFNVIVVGLGLLTVGTLLGGIWANESWGRYWGWDPKETWSLVTILTYAVVSHFRLIPSLRDPWYLAAGGFAAIASVIMTFFGVNFFLAGLHSYAQGGATRVPTWVPVGAALMLILITLSYLVSMNKEWQASAGADPAGAHVDPPKGM